MHPSVSNAEMALFQALSEAGLTSNMITQKTIILKSTIPDFCWVNKRKIVYLDGRPVHKKDKQIERDEEIDDLLTAQGWEVLRIPYNPPLSDKCLKEILVNIKQFLRAEEDEET
jgi:very-short-patch-repair endonuclease